MKLSLKAIVIFCLIVGMTTSALAICAQASPANCSSYYAVACHGEATHTMTSSGDLSAYAMVHKGNFIPLDEQDVNCGEVIEDPFNNPECPYGGH